MTSHHPQRARWRLDGPWRIKDERPEAGNPRPYVEDPTVGAGSSRPARRYVEAGYDDRDWREVPPATHLQPWLYPDNPYWGPEVRQVNEAAWWYRTRFRVPLEAQGQRLRLLFEGVDYYAEVWCNGERMGQHEGSFSPFCFDVTDRVRWDGGENTLVVRVTSPWDAKRRRGLTYVDEVERAMVKGLYAHGDGWIPPDVNPIGIWRPVWLEAHSDVTLDRIPYTVVEDEYDRSALLTLRLHVHNRRSEPVTGVLHTYLAGETFEAIRANAHSSIEVPPGKTVIEHQTRIADPQWWWPWDLGAPDLYRLRCTLWDSGPQDAAPGGLAQPAATDGQFAAGSDRPLDVYEQVLGLRQVRLLRSQETMHFQVNKLPFYVRGTTYVGGLYLSQLTSEQIEADMDSVRECGLNLVRLHVHVAPPAVYEACDRRGILIWQDFELNWLHDPSPEFEERAVALQRAMVEQLDPHPSVLTWCCHNEPSALPFQDRNLTEGPTRRLYREITALDPSRPAYLCSGKQEEDWLHSGDTHAYVGGGHGGQYAEVYGRRSRLVTEFGCEAPPDPETLDETPLLAERLAHLRDRIPDIQAYQARLLKYQIEWYRITRFAPCGGYIQFMLCDLYPQVGCGVLDAARRPRAAYEALKTASQPVHVLMEHTPTDAVALWAVNDQGRPLIDCLVEWALVDAGGTVVTRGSAQVDLPAQRAHRVTVLDWHLKPDERYRVQLRLLHRGQVLDENHYEDPFRPLPRPKGYPWQFDRTLGMRCYGGPHAQSSLKVLNTWYGRLATWILPVYPWAEEMLARKPDPKVNAWLKRFFG